MAFVDSAANCNLDRHYGLGGLSLILSHSPDLCQQSYYSCPRELSVETAAIHAKYNSLICLQIYDANNLSVRIVTVVTTLFVPNLSRFTAAACQVGCRSACWLPYAHISCRILLLGYYLHQ